MATSTLQHRRTHNLLLISKLLDQRDNASPFTLILDSLEQSGKPLVTEYIKRANASKVQIVFISFETLRKQNGIDVFVPAWDGGSASWTKEVLKHLRTHATQRKLLVVDSLNPLASTEAANLPAILSSFISPTTSLLATYHTDIPILRSVAQGNVYSPPPLTLLRYLATTVFTTHSLHHVLAREAARDRSHAEPSFGLGENRDGVLQGLGANVSEGIVLEMEHRRKSGRGVTEWYFLRLRSGPAPAQPSILRKSQDKLSLLEDHPLYRSNGQETITADARSESQMESTFAMGLTDKQRKDREGVVLPYFDAQKDGGDGGRILYDMGSEDDFDEEEDEI